MRQVLQNTSVLLQMSAGITNCLNYYETGYNSVVYKWDKPLIRIILDYYKYAYSSKLQKKFGFEVYLSHIS